MDILYAYADMSPDLIDASVTQDARGIAIAEVGNGNMNKVSIDAAARADLLRLVPLHRHVQLSL